MADKKTPPDRIDSADEFRVYHGLIAGSMRSIAGLFLENPACDIKAIWRNETGKATVTGTRPAS